MPGLIMPKLTPDQKKLFDNLGSTLRKEVVIQFIKSGYENGTQAYLKACRKLNRKPSKNPHTSGSEILNYPQVIEYINSFKLKVAEDTKIDADYVLNNLQKTYELDILDIMTEDLNNFKPLSEWPKQWRISISGLDLMVITNKDEDDDIQSIIKKIKWPDKVNILEKIGKHTKVGAFSEKIELSLRPMVKTTRKRFDGSQGEVDG